MTTARQIIAHELIAWLERSDVAVFTEIQCLEDQVRIWEYGKWCAMTGDQLGYQPQLRFRGSRPESTAWDAIPGMSDEDAMRIAEATRRLEPVELEIITRLYQHWQSVHNVRADLRIGMTSLDAFRLSALRTIARSLAERGQQQHVRNQPV